jgi:TRAP-type C4-dicarboxylate transport system permease small subunit
MNPTGPLALGFLRPGGVFLATLALLIAVALLGRALLVRRIGDERLDRATRMIEGGVFCLVLGLMILFSGLQVVLRNLFHHGLLWIDPLARTLVLWVAFIGAMAATSQGRHLHIDVIKRQFSPERGRRLGRILSFAAALCCAFMAEGAFVYLREEAGHGSALFWGIPSWAAQSILLWGFALLTYRFLVQMIWPAPVHPPTNPVNHP